MIHRILISHSIRAGHPAMGLRDALVQALEDAPDTRPWLDEGAFATGIPWRLVNDEWIWGCDGAVLLLSQSAIESAYVRYEAQVLRQRWLVDKRDFPFVIVRLPDLEESDLSKTVYGPLQLDEIQQVRQIEPASLDDPAALVQTILDALQPLHEQATLTPRHALEERVFRMLSAEAAPKEPFRTSCKRLFGKEIEAGGQRLMALRYTRELFDRAYDGDLDAVVHFRKLIDELSTIIGKENTRAVLCNAWPFWWVDEKAAAQLAYFEPDNEAPALGWSRVWPLSTEMHAMRAFHRTDVVLAATSDATGSSTDQALDHARKCLSKELFVPPLPPPIADRKINEAIAAHRAAGRPVFLLVTPTDLERAMADEYRKTWPQIRLFVDCGYDNRDLLATPGLDWVLRVEPEPGLDAEIAAAQVWADLMKSQGQKIENAYDESLELLPWL